MPTDVADGRPAQQPTQPNGSQVAVVRSRSIRKNPWKKKIDEHSDIRPCCHPLNSKPYECVLSIFYAMTDKDNS